ncbi:MAG: hypothetical protein PF588_07420 [Candidatus Kapabacteria bacterium]|nr:hypothetical protein [Candidatus Kapabacteria bacterium]
MSRIRLISFVLIISVIVSINSQAEVRLDNWQSHTSMTHAVAAVVDDEGIIWTATPGGVFSYDPAADMMKAYTNIEGLMSTDITAISANAANGNIFVGSFDGYIDIISDDEIFHITDIAVKGYPNPIIKDIIIKDSLAYIAGGFGLTVFDVNEKVFLETVDNLGDFQQNTTVNDLLISDGKIWAATDDGIACVDLSSYKRDPAVWTNYAYENGLPKESIRHIAFHNNQLYASADTTIYVMQADTFVVWKTLKSYESITGMSSVDGDIYYATAYNIFKNSTPLTIDRPSYYSGFAQGFIDGENRLLPLFTQSGIGILRNDDLQIISPKTSSSNLFLDMDVDSDGNLWAATGYGGFNQGFRVYDGEKWHNFDLSNYEGLPTNDYFKVFVRSDGCAVLSSWGKGYAIVKRNAGGEFVPEYFHKNTPMTPIATAESWIIAAEADEDFYGATWIINYGETSNGPVLISIDKDGSYYSFINRYSSNSRWFTELVIDFSGTKWLGCGNISGSKGMYYFNERGTPDDDSDDIYGTVTTSNSALSDMGQNCLAVDKTGLIWIGTSNGLDVIYNPSAVMSDGNIVLGSNRFIGKQVINDIYVDPLNNKWIATNTGVWILNADASEVLDIITAEHSKLISNEVKAITSDPQNGKIYFGTLKGLSEATSLSVEPSDKYDIKCYPQPFNIAKDEEMIIDGLAKDTDLRILTINGQHVRTLSGFGKIARWDGRDKNGELVASAVYIIVATSGDSDERAVAKAAVIRK